MGKLQTFEKEKLILGVLYHDLKILDAALGRLTDAFGPIDDSTEVFSFSRENSTYYDQEIGGEVFRRIYSFEMPVNPDRQAEIKTFTNRLEAEFSQGEQRKINLDPGFINIGRVMLATTKGASFRIPLSDGIYTEITLFYARGSWQSLPWTYTDYKSERVQKFLSRVHKKYLSQRKEGLV